jgi:hypothetical protein
MHLIGLGEGQVNRMAVMDEFKKEREAMKQGTLKQRIAYYWLYYKWYVIVTVAIIAFIISFVHNILTRKEDAFAAAFINAWEQEDAENYLNGFVEVAGIDTSKFQINMDSYLYLTEGSLDQTTMVTTQKVMVYIASNSLDVLAADESTFRSYAYGEVLVDLRTLLSPQQLERYKPYFYYIDSAVQARKATMEESDGSSEGLVYPDPTKPELMEDPIPVAVFINNSPSLEKAYSFSEENVPMGIIVNSKRQQTALTFLDYVMQDAT